MLSSLLFVRGESELDAQADRCHFARCDRAELLAQSGFSRKHERTRGATRGHSAAGVCADSRETPAPDDSARSVIAGAARPQRACQVRSQARIEIASVRVRCSDGMISRL